MSKPSARETSRCAECIGEVERGERDEPNDAEPGSDLCWQHGGVSV